MYVDWRAAESTDRDSPQQVALGAGCGLGALYLGLPAVALAQAGAASDAAGTLGPARAGTVLLVVLRLRFGACLGQQPDHLGVPGRRTQRRSSIRLWRVRVCAFGEQR